MKKCQWCSKEADPDCHMPSGNIYDGNKELYYCNEHYKKVQDRIMTVLRMLEGLE
jgi:hypothetical protein